MTTHRFLQAALGLFLFFATAQACGPDFYADVFVRASGPDLPAQFVQGHLGILQPTFARADFFVAYRYLNGGTLNIAEQKAWSPAYSVAETNFNKSESLAGRPEEADTSLAQWIAARAGFPGAPSKVIDPEARIKAHLQGGYEYDVSYLNCANDAFRSATATLRMRATQWGSSSPALLDWLHAQDAVFSDCDGGDTIPQAAPANSPAPLQQDRAYQIAAAKFYSQDYASAVASFRAISQDRNSPWQPGSGYLAARALVRQAFFAKPTTGEPAEYDSALMKAAEDQLRAYLASAPPPEWRKAAEAKLAFITIRLQPVQRAAELSQLVSGPAHDPNYAQDLQDLLWVADKQTPGGLRAQPEMTLIPLPDHPGETRQATPSEAQDTADAARTKAYDGTAALRAASPILDWTITVQTLAPSAPAHALQQWRSTHSEAWLAAALMLTANRASGVDDLLQAAAAVPDSAPAWQTVTYHRARLLLASGHTREARDLLSSFTAKLQAIPAAQREPSTVNATRGLQALAAASTRDFLVFAPQTMLLHGSEEGSSVDECQSVMNNDHNRHYDCVSKVTPEQLDSAVAQVFNMEAPLSVWLSATNSQAVPAQVRQAIAEEGWTRATLLGDHTAAASFLTLLPPKLQDEVKQPTPLATWMTLARNPGLNPYLNGGIQRAYSYDFVESYRDNWCYKLDGGSWWKQPVDEPGPPPAAFLDAATLQHGQQEASKLAGIRSLYVGQQIIHGVQANTQDPAAPEALFLVLRMIRYGCVEPAPVPPLPGKPNLYSGFVPTQEAKDLLQLKQDASRLLRRYYAASPWTKKAAPFAG